MLERIWIIFHKEVIDNLRDRRSIANSLMASLFVTGCAGIEPYEPRNHREEGPQKGLFTGSKGEFVIFRKADEPEKGTEEKKAETKSGEQQP